MGRSASTTWARKLALCAPSIRCCKWLASSVGEFGTNGRQVKHSLFTDYGRKGSSAVDALDLSGNLKLDANNHNSHRSSTAEVRSDRAS